LQSEIIYKVPELKREDEDLQSNLDNIGKVIADLNNRRDKGLSEDLENNIKKQLMISHVYHSNAIEGNRLTLRETELILNNMVINERPLKDELEARDLAIANDYLEDLISGYETINYKTILKLHQLVLRTSNEKYAGVFRNIEVKIKESDHIPPDHLHIEQNMKTMFQWMNRNSSYFHPIEMGAIIHHWITWVHPFTDGNGRVARLFLNFFLLQKGYPEVIIRIDDRDKYYEALIQADNGKMEKLILLISENVRKTVDLYESFINEEERKKEWGRQYKKEGERRKKEAESKHKYYYNIWINNILVFQNLMERHLDEISDNLTELEIEYESYEPFTMNKYFDLLEGRKVSHTWVFRFKIFDDIKNIKLSCVFYAKNLSIKKPLAMLGVNVIDQKTGKQAMQEIASNVAIYFSTKTVGHSESNLIKEEIDLVHINSFEDRLTFSVKNRSNIQNYNFITKKYDFIPQIVQDKETPPEEIIQKFLSQILKYYYDIPFTDVVIES